MLHPYVLCLIASVVCFAIGFIRSGLGGLSWTDAGLGFAVLSMLVR